jgi:mRNA interferase RelE/StbE
MRFEILYHQAVISEDISKLSREWRDTIQVAIEKKLTSNPEIFGKPLRHSLKGYRKLRVGDYRVIFRIEESIVKIFVIQHRSVVYKVLKKRI